MIEEFACKLCGFVKEYPNEDSPWTCPECGRSTYRLSFLKEPRAKTKFVNVGYKDTPRYSITMGVTETQIEQARKLHPQVEWKKFGHSYRPLIKNRTEKLRMMKQCDMEEFDTKQFKGRQ